MSQHTSSHPTQLVITTQLETRQTPMSKQGISKEGSETATLPLTHLLVPTAPGLHNPGSASPSLTPNPTWP